VLSIHAQSTLKGRIVSTSDADKPIANAVLITNQQRYFFSDFEGKFSIDLNDEEEIVRVLSKNYETLRQPSHFSPLKMKTLESSQAEELPDDAIDQVAKAQLASTNFSFESLSKTEIKNSETEFLLRKAIEARLTEEEGLQQKYKAVSVQGLEGVVPKMINRDLFSFNWFSTFIEIFDERFVSPFNTLNTINYQFYKIYETDEVQIISFEPLLNGFQRSFQGILILDKKSSKFERIQATLDADFRLNLLSEFDLKTGLPKHTKLNIKPGTGGVKLSFFGAGLQFGRLQKKNPDEEAELNYELVNYNLVAKDSIPAYPRSLSKILEDKDEVISNDYWSQFDYSFIKNNNINPSRIASYVEKNNIKRKVKRISAFDAGYFPIGIVDVDLTRLFKANNYEGLRLGLGLQTNQTFSERYRLGAFTAYGTQDGNFKYGLNGGVLLDSDSASWLNVFYDNDIEEVGMNNYLTDQRVYTLFEPRLVNITFFYKYEKYGLSLQHNFSPQLITEFKVDRSSISQTRDYAFLNDGNAFTNYDLTSATFGLRWTPNYSYSKVGKRIYINNAFTPVVSAQLSQSFEGVLEGDFSFTKLSAKVDYDFNHSWGSTSTVELGGDLGFGDIPLMHAFHAFPNSPNKEGVFDRFSVAGVKSFETMYFNEFFSTKLATLHLKHKLAPIKLTNTLQPEVVLISRHAIGDFANPEQHQNIQFNTLSKGYNEAGLELNKLFFGFGLSFAYRYGAYHLPSFEDNISFKFTFYLKL
jgi:hypothetical protein